MERKQVSASNPLLLTTVLPTKKVAIRILNDNKINTLQECAQLGTEKLLSIDGIGVAILLSLRRECHRRGVEWSLCEYERNAEIGVSRESALYSNAYEEWMKAIIDKKLKAAKDKKMATA